MQKLILCLALLVSNVLVAADDKRETLLRDMLARRRAAGDLVEHERTPMLAGTELIQDGSFETGPGNSGSYTFTAPSGAWSYSDSAYTRSPRYWSASTLPAHTGLWAIYFDPFGPCTDKLSQQLTIPAGSTATLSFWLDVGTFEITSSRVYDTFSVMVQNSAGSTLANLASFSNLDDTPAKPYNYVKHSYDISAYAGQTIRIAFSASNDVNNPTIFMLDDVSVVASAGSASGCVEDAFTMCLVNGRYKVTSHWKNQYSTTPVVANLAKTKLTDKTGAFWIADADTYEYLIRFNTATNNGKIWLNVTTFTSVEFWVEVTDTVNGRTKEYHNAPGDTAMIWDPNTFIYP